MPAAMLDWTERVTVVLTAVFAVTLALTIYADEPRVWLLWAAAMVIFAGAALIAVNRSDR